MSVIEGCDFVIKCLRTKIIYQLLRLACCDKLDLMYTLKYYRIMYEFLLLQSITFTSISFKSHKNQSHNSTT